MESAEIITRRAMIALLLGSAAVLPFAGTARAKDGDDDGGDDSGGGESGGDNGDNSGDSGDNEGSDGDSGGDDNGDDNGSDGGNSGSGSSGSSPKGGSSGSGKSDQDRAKAAVRSGEAIPLAKALSLLQLKYSGRVIEVQFVAKGDRIDYKFKLIDGNGKVQSVTMDARTGRLRGFFGF